MDPTERRLRIWHVDAGADPDSADGQGAVVWRLAAGQAAAGHEVTLFVHAPPSPAACRLAEQSGVRVVEIRRSVLRYPPWRVVRAGGSRPHIVVIHSSWVPAHAALAWWFRRTKQPYAWVAHGAHSPALLAAGRRRRRAYIRVAEWPATRGAVAAFYSCEAEAKEAEAMFGRTLKRIAVVPFPGPTTEITPCWELLPGTRPIVCLACYDVFQKGIDDLCDVARQSPELNFDLYGEEPSWPDALVAFRAVRAGAPPNVHFRGPVFGEEKRAMLCSAGLYIQFSRFEAFPLAVTEAMASGLPVACAERLPFARGAAEHGAVELLPVDPSRAADRLRALVADRDRLEQLSAAALAYVEERIDVAALAERHARLYASVLRTANER